MRSIAAALAAALVVLAPVSLDGWGLDVHRFITGRALDGLPPDVKPFFALQRDFIAEHSVDPDMWRIVGLKGDRGDEDPNHFLDIDALDEPRPFTNVPREWPALVQRYGLDRATRAGRLPWRAEDIYRQLVTRFREVGKGTPGYAADNARYLSAILAHYVEDAHQPFHAVANYDGQLTNQRGIHARFETELVLRNLKTLKLAPVAVRPIPDFKAFMFETIVASEGLVQEVLDADRTAADGREFYDDAYFAALLTGARRVMEKRVAEAASGVASAIVAAWVEAGKPALPVAKAVTPARIRR
jgi:hypothetical protein